MHSRMTSALFVVPAMLLSLRPAAAQSNSAAPQPLQASAEKLAATAKLQELLKNHDLGTIRLQTPSTGDAANALQAWQGLLRQHQQNGPLTVKILPPNDASNCAHIIERWHGDFQGVATLQSRFASRRWDASSAAWFLYPSAFCFKTAVRPGPC